MNNRLIKLFTNCPSYFKKGVNQICERANCTPQQLMRFRATDWYKTNRKRYCHD